jgi:hypothetical protein
MYARLSLASICFIGLALGCTSSTDISGDHGRAGQALEYVQSCTPAECDELAVPQIGCASGSDPTLTCAPGDDGTCHVTPTCDGDGDGTVSYAPCEPVECGPIPQIGCPPDYTLVESCGSENDAACKWTITCTPPPSTTPCATPDGCGPMPAIGVVCDDGSSGTLACMQTESECSWQPQCP